MPKIYWHLENLLNKFYHGQNEAQYFTISVCIDGAKQMWAIYPNTLMI